VAKKQRHSKEFRPGDFAEALKYQLRVHRDTPWSLASILSPNDSVETYRKLRSWVFRGMYPRTRSSLAIVRQIELRYRLKAGYFARILVVSHPSYRRVNCSLGPFHKELNFQMRMHGDTGQSLAKAIYRPGDPNKERVINRWKVGRRTPTSKIAYAYLERIEHYYQLPLGHFSALLALDVTAEQRARLQVNGADRNSLNWHLSKDFNDRSEIEQEKILSWVKSNIIGSLTEYGNFHGAVTRHG
jgi:hypothetical protein